MTSASLFEQLTSSVSLSMVTIISVVTLALILISTVACRVFFSKSSKSTSSSKQHSNKEKKSKEINTKKQQADLTSANKKKNTKTKKVAAVTPPTSQSEESEEEKVIPVATNKKAKTTPDKPATGKKVAADGENKKTGAATNGTKTPPTPPTKQAPIRAENTDGVQSGDAKKKQSKTSGASASANATAGANKQQTTGKGEVANKVNTTTSNKKQPVVTNPEVNRTPDVDNEAGNEPEDDGQWVTQSSKQVGNRNKNKGKVEPSNQGSSNRKSASEKRTVPTTSASTHSSSTHKNESDVETSTTSHIPLPPIQPQEPIEVCQLLPTSENRYTASDDWWKQALNKQQTFSVDDIGEWPERDQDEEYVVKINRIIPIKTKTALSEKDVNVEVDGNDEINHYQNGNTQRRVGKLDQEDDEQQQPTNSSSVITGEAKISTSQSKKKSTNVRRLS